MKIIGINKKLGLLLNNNYKNKVTKLNDASGFSIVVNLTPKFRSKIKKSKKIFRIILYFILNEKTEQIKSKKMYSITFESRLVQKKKDIYIPINEKLNNKTLNGINSVEEIYFYPIDNTFYYKNKKRFYNIKQLINYFNELQFNLPLKARIITIYRKTISTVPKITSKILEVILYLITGDKFKHEYESRFILLDSTKINGGLIEPTQIQSIKVPVFGFDAPVWPIFTYCSINIIIFLLFSFLNIKPLFIKTILNNNFLSICYLISSFTIFQLITPMILRKTIIKLAVMYPNNFKPVPID